MSASPKSKASRKRKSPNSDVVSAENDHPEQPRKRRKFSESTNSSNINRNDEAESAEAVDSEKNNDPIQFALRSWCWRDPNPYKSYIKLTNNSTQTKGLKIFDVQKRRGHRIVVIDGCSGDIEQSIAFDSWADIFGGIRLKIFLQTMQYKPNKWIIIITHDSGYNVNTEVMQKIYI